MQHILPLHALTIPATKAGKLIGSAELWLQVRAIQKESHSIGTVQLDLRGVSR